MSAQFGSFEWTLHSGGRMTGRERARALRQIAVLNLEVIGGFARLASGRRSAGSARVDVDSFIPPDSRLAGEFESACAEQSPGMIGHSYRAWMFGTALAQFDGVALDPELFYCSALVHDLGIESPVPGEDFTIRAARRAIQCAHNAGADHAAGTILADAITYAANPAMDYATDGMGAYVAAGAMVDGGIRLWDLSRHNVDRVLARHPRAPGFKGQLAGLIRDEATANPGGRFSLYHRCGFGLLVMAAPVPAG